MSIDYKVQLLSNVLPWWVEHGVDAVNGGVFTCFSDAGSPMSSEKYTWSQGRWAWLCARLARDANAGILQTDSRAWSERAVQTARFIQRHALMPGNVTAYRTTADGTPLVSNDDGGVAVSVLADLFAALGLAGAASIQGAAEQDKDEWLDSAHRLLRHAQTRIDARTAPSEPYPVRAGFTDSASLMLLLNVGTELHRATGRYDMRGVVESVLNRLLQDSHHPSLWLPHSWWEFQPDTPADSDSMLARHRTPGHLLEMLWMVLDSVQAFPELGDSLPVWLPDLALLALRIGWDEQFGGLFRYVDADGGRPQGRLFGNDRYEALVMDTWDTKLWWVHVEALYATRVLADISGREDLRQWHERIARYTFDTFPDPRGNEWIQIRDRRGAELDKVVALPVKDPFHISRALLLMIEADRKGAVQ